MTLLFISVLIFLFFSAGCCGAASKYPFRAARLGRTTQEDGLALSDGIWTFRGYGYVISVTNGTASAFEETDTSCIENPLLLMLITSTQEVDESVARLTAFRFVPYFVVDKTDTFQAACMNGSIPFLGDDDYIRDALEVFDVLDQTFLENFAHFQRLDGGKSEWVQKAAEERAVLASDSTDEELVSAFESLLVPLDDYHTWVIDENGIGLVWSHPFLSTFQEEFEQQNEIDDFETYQQEKIIKPWRDAVVSYVDSVTLEESGLVWGKTNESIGYMQLLTVPNDIFSFTSEFEAALVTLNDTDALVLDIRINAGGSDETALLIASYFTSEPFLAFTKQAMGGDVVEVHVEPSQKVYNGPIVVIISRESYSAAETLPLALMQLPQTILLGRNTGGSYSELPKTLPNGWAFSLFAEVYLSPDGIDYDLIGIPPDVLPDAELLPLKEREDGIDSWLELALKAAQDAASPTSDAASACMSYFFWLVFFAGLMLI